MRSLKHTSVQRLAAPLLNSTNPPRGNFVRARALTRRRTLQASLTLPGMATVAAHAQGGSSIVSVAIVGTGTFAKAAWSPLLKCVQYKPWLASQLLLSFSRCSTEVVALAASRTCAAVVADVACMQALRGRVLGDLRLESIRSFSYSVCTGAAREHVRDSLVCVACLQTIKMQTVAFAQQVSVS
jgi:hypothetical protein